MRHRFSYLFFALIALRLVDASSASAQAWVDDPNRAGGRGIRLGNFELHPGIGSEIGYESNVFLAEPGKTQSSGVLRVGPYIFLSTLGQERMRGEPERVKLRAGANASLKHYFAFTDNTDVGIGEDAKLTLQPSSIFAWDLFESFTRSIDPFTEVPTGGASIGFGRDQLGLGTRLQLSTRGALFKAGLGYRFDLDSFEDANFGSNDNTSHTVLGDTSWEFLPKTAIFWNGSVQLRGFSGGATTPMGTPEHNDATVVNNKIGLNGALTERFGFTLAVGYSAGFSSDDSDSESIIAQVEGRWRFRENMNLSLGYDRELVPAFQGNFHRVDRVKTNLQATFATKWVLGANVELAFLTFGHDSNLVNPDRSDMQLSAGLNGEYRMLEWLALTGDLSLRKNFTKYEFVFMSTTGPDVIDPAEYTAFAAWLGVRAFF